MTDFEARTTSNMVDVEDKDAVRRLIKKYTFDDACPELTEEGLGVYGYSWFTAERDMYIDENESMTEEEEILFCTRIGRVGIGRVEEKTDTSEDMTEEFLNRLAEIIPRGKTLEIHEIGGEGLRFPFWACRIKVEGHYGAEFETFF